MVRMISAGNAKKFYCQAFNFRALRNVLHNTWLLIWFLQGFDVGASKWSLVNVELLNVRRAGNFVLGG